jgi:predicted AlkP superfamily pyrophosphatase or phosphodiesterase
MYFHGMRYLYRLSAVWLSMAAVNTPAPVLAQDTTQHIIYDRLNSPAQEQKPYVILISADGFRYDLADKYQATNLLRLRSEGVQADYLESSYPSLTFPNHYAIVTGLYPAHNGLVDNSFYDPARNAFYGIRDKKAVQDSSWYGGVPLWVLAEQYHMLSASFYWVASEAAIDGLRPTYSYVYNEAISIDDRIEAVKNWLSLPPERRPHMITFYFPEVDHAEHRFGPDAWQTKSAVQFVDQSVGKLVSEVATLNLPVSYVFVSDHGMTTVDTLHTLPLPDAVDTSKFIVPPGASLLHLYAKDKKDIKPTFLKLKAEAKDFDVYLATDMPARWHYGKKDDRYDRLGDIILVPHLPHIFNIHGGHVSMGEHGFDPAFPEMHATFYAWGPAFKSAQKIPGFDNVNIYPMIAKILGLPIVEKIDGKVGVLDGILK